MSHLLTHINPQLSLAADEGRVSVSRIGVSGEWPTNFWDHALSDLYIWRPSNAHEWTDPTFSRLTGWQGSDTRTGQKLFVLMVFRLEQYHTMDIGDESEGGGAVRSVANSAGLTATREIRNSTSESGDPGAHRRAEPGISDLEPHGIDFAPESALLTSRFGPFQTAPLVAVEHDLLTATSFAANVVSLRDEHSRHYIGFGPRLTAHMIDFAFILLFPIVGLALTYLLNPKSTLFSNRGGIQDYLVVAVALIGVFGLYHVLQIGLWGQTLGKKLIGIQVVTVDGRIPSFARSLLRMLGFGFSFIIAGWGLVMLVLDSRKQGLHDKIAETYVVPEELPVGVPAGLGGFPPTSSDGRVQLSAQAPAQFPLPSMGLASVGYIAASENQDAPRAAEFADDLLTGPFTGFEPELRSGRIESRPNAEIARSLFKTGLTVLQSGVVPGRRGFKVDPAAARVAAASLKESLDLVPTSVLYRYFYAVALRYSEGFEIALREFKRVIEADPDNFNARHQISYGPRWHDAFSYPSWPGNPPARAGDDTPLSVLELLPPGDTAVTRIVLLREGANKVVAFLSRAPRSSWSVPPQPHMSAGLDVVLSRTAHGPILALYVMLADGIHSPYVGETFLNPRDSPNQADDACQLGQHMIEQLARQNYTYLIFVDDQYRLLLSRRLPFDTATQVMLARVLYETQTLPPQPLALDRFREAAQWHMQHFSLEVVAEKFRPL